MKKIKQIILCAAAGAAFAACSSGDTLGTDYLNDPSAVVLSANVGKVSVSSRTNPIGTTGNTAFVAGDKVAVRNEGAYSFVTYTLGSDAVTWSPETNQYLTWNSNTLRFRGYYPAGSNDASMTTFTVPVNQSEYHTLSANDIALADYMTVDDDYTKPTDGTTAVALAFNRQTSRVIVQIDKLGDEYGTAVPTISDVQIHGKASLTGSTFSGVTPYANVDAAVVGSTYTALLLPASAEQASEVFISLKSNGTTLNVTGIPAMEAGKSYTYHLTVGKNTLKVSSVQVANWQTGETLDVTTEEYGRVLTIIPTTSITDALLDQAVTDDGKLTIKGVVSTLVQADPIINYLKKSPKVKSLDISGLAGIPTDMRTNWGIKSTYIESVAIPSTVTGIYRVFYDCTSLKSVTGLDNVNDAADAFENCKSLTEAPTMPKLTILSSKIFEGSGITNYSSTQITEIESHAFQGSALKTIDCSNVTKLSHNLFYGCSNLETVKLTSSSFSYVHSYVNGCHCDPFSGIPSKKATLYLNANQKARITATSTDCTWKPFDSYASKTQTNGLEKDVILTDFKAVFCGDDQVYPPLQ